MAELFLAKHVGMEGFEKVVAIKRILSHLAYDEEFINMFRDEARLVAKLSHQNIVQIYDLGKSNESYFIAMEYIPGRNLASVAKKARQKGEPLQPVYIARCVAQACEALHYAHTRTDLDGRPLGIVHRDVSPQNIIVAFSGGVKLVDFGIAKAASKIGQTRAGVLKGKYAYMCPEQIRGEAIDGRCDIFAVGIVLYELLCGRRPFEKENSIQTLKAIVQEPHVDPRELNPAIPDALADIINRALIKDPNLRYDTAQATQLALEDFVSASGQRCNNIVIGEWLTRLFEDELERGKGNTVTFKGVGEVILPPSEQLEPGQGEDEPAFEPPRERQPIPPAETRPADRRPVPQAPSILRRVSSRGGLIEEGDLPERSRPGFDDDESTRLAAEEIGDDQDGDDVAQIVAPPAALFSGPDRRYEEAVRPSTEPPPPDDAYDDSMTEALQESSPLHARLAAQVAALRSKAKGGEPGAGEPTLGVAASQLKKSSLVASQKAKSEPAVIAPASPTTPEEDPDDGTLAVEPDPDDERFLVSPKVAPEPVADRAIALKVEVSAPEPAEPGEGTVALADSVIAHALESGQAIDLRSDDPDEAILPELPSSGTADVWAERTNSSGGSTDLVASRDLPSVADVPVQVETADPVWGDRSRTSSGGDPSERIPPAETAAGDLLAEMEEMLGGAGDLPPVWNDATSANPAGSLRSSSLDLAAEDDDEPWADKTVGEPGADDGFDSSHSMFRVEDTVGLTAEELAAELAESGVDAAELAAAMPRSDLDDDEDPDDSTHWGGKSTVAEPGSREIEIELELPAKVDRSRSPEVDSRTFAASSKMLKNEGVDRVAGNDFAYDVEATREATSALAPVVPKTSLGAMRLAKASAAPRGGVRELDFEIETQEGTPDLAVDVPAPTVNLEGLRELDADFGNIEQETEELSSLLAKSPGTVPTLEAAGKPKTPLPAPAAPRPREDPAPLSLEFEDGLPERPAPKAAQPQPQKPRPSASPIQPEASPSALEDLFAPSAPRPLAPNDPLAAVGSTRVPAAAVSLSDVLLGEDHKKVPDVSGKRSAASIRGATPMHGAARSGGASASSAPLTPLSTTSNPGVVVPPQLLRTLSRTPSAVGIPQIAPRRQSASILSLAVKAFVLVVVSAVVGAAAYVYLRAPRLEVMSDPPGAQVLVDGRPLPGKTPLSLEVQAGHEYKLELVHAGYQKLALPVKVPEGRGRWSVRYALVREVTSSTTSAVVVPTAK